MCSDLYLLDIFINLIYYYCYNYYNYYNYFIPPPHLAAPQLSFVSLLLSFECFCFSGYLPPTPNAGPGFSGTFLCVCVSVFPCVSALHPSSIHPGFFHWSCLSSQTPFLFWRLLEKYNPTDCETEPPLQAKDFIMFRNL